MTVNHKKVEPRCDYISRQAELGVIAAVNVPDELVHLGAIALRGQVNRLFVGVAAGEQTAQAKECAAADTRARYALVVGLGLDEQNAHAASDIDQNVRIGARELEVALLELAVAEARLVLAVVVQRVGVATHCRRHLFRLDLEVVALAVAVDLVEELHALDEHVHLVALVPADVELLLDDVLELEGAAAARKHLKGERVQLAADAQRQEHLHLVGGKADEVQVAEPVADLLRLELQVDVANARVAVGRVADEVVADRAQHLALLHLLVLGQVERLEVDQLDECAADVDAEPRKVYFESEIYGSSIF